MKDGILSINAETNIIKITAISLVVILLTFIFFRWYKYSIGLLDDPRVLITFVPISIPFITAVLLRLFLKRLQVLLSILLAPLVVINILLLCVGIFIFIDQITTPLTTWEKELTEQSKIENAVQKWIRRNAEYPNSYKPMSSETYFVYKFKNGSDSSYLNDGFYVDRDSMSAKDLSYKCFFVKHIHIIKRKDNQTDTVQAFFQVTPQMQVVNIGIWNGNTYSVSEGNNYLWREKYGNNNVNLELETNSDGVNSYYYKMFIKTLTQLHLLAF